MIVSLLALATAVALQSFHGLSSNGRCLRGQLARRPMTADTTIIVNIYNGEQRVTECLDSILAPLASWGFKAGIVDDASGGAGLGMA